jgi:hypothetical protein
MALRSPWSAEWMDGDVVVMHFGGLNYICCLHFRKLQNETEQNRIEDNILE